MLYIKSNIFQDDVRVRVVYTTTFADKTMMFEKLINL